MSCNEGSRTHAFLNIGIQPKIMLPQSKLGPFLLLNVACPKKPLRNGTKNVHQPSHPTRIHLMIYLISVHFIILSLGLQVIFTSKVISRSFNTAAKSILLSNVSDNILSWFPVEVER